MIFEINHVCDRYKNECVSIYGEFNFLRTNWQIRPPINNNKYSDAFVVCIISNCLEQLVFFQYERTEYT